MKLSDALHGVKILETNCGMDKEVFQVSNDSRNTRAGGIFAAVMGIESGLHRIRFAPRSTRARSA